MIVGIEKARNHVLRRSAGLSTAERNKDDLVAVKRGPIPASMLADEGSASIIFGELAAVVHGEPQRCHVRAQRVVRHDRLGHEIRSLWLNARVEMASIV